MNKFKPTIRTFFFKCNILHKKLIEPRIDLTPAKCKEKIAKSTLVPECAIFLDKGG
jgi:hypothetical protein